MDEKLSDYLNLIYRLITYANCEERTVWLKKIPEINFPEKYNIKLIAPRTPAIIHYHITLKENENCLVSIFLDCYGLIGVYNGPYWEIYPLKKESIKRCGMYDINKLLKYIDESLQEQKKNNNMGKKKNNNMEKKKKKFRKTTIENADLKDIIKLTDTILDDFAKKINNDEQEKRNN